MTFCKECEHDVPEHYEGRYCPNCWERLPVRKLKKQEDTSEEVGRR